MKALMVTQSWDVLKHVFRHIALRPSVKITHRGGTNREAAVQDSLVNGL